MTKSLEQHLCILRNFTAIYMQRALDLAKDGQKDEARDWLRFFENSEILFLLADPQIGIIPVSEFKILSEILVELRSECHPLDEPNYRTDLQIIRAELKAISAHLGMGDMAAHLVALH